VGKSLLFRNLTNRYVTVSNYPGTTVEVVRARASFNGQRHEIIDSPGINDLTPHSDDARVTRGLIDDDPDATIVQVADAKNLRRALLLTMQLAELGRPMVLAVNMLDELEERGGVIDTERLGELLGIPVVGTVAPNQRGMDTLIEGIRAARRPTPQPIAAPDAGSHYALNRARLDRVNQVLAGIYRIEQPHHASFRVRLGFWSMAPIRGLLVLAAVVGLVFWFVGLFGAGTLVDGTETGLFQQRLNPAAIRATDALLPFPHTHAVETISQDVSLPITPVSDVVVGTFNRVVIVPDYTMPAAPLRWFQHVLRFIHDFFVGQYGAITMALSYAFAIVLPIVTTFFFAFSILEDSGYFPRMAILVNRAFRRIGLNGKAVLPMILGLGCDTMATMTTRILETRKERIITTMLLALAVPCSAQLGVLLAMMATLAPASALVWVGLVLGVLMLVGWLTARVVPGDPSDFILEIPPMRRPQFSNVVMKTFSRIGWYLREVIPIFVVGTGILFLLDKLTLLGRIARLAEPLVTGWLGLPAETANAFLIGFMRRDFGAVYILDAATGPNATLSPHQILVAMVTITLFIPCIANLLMIAKEHGQKVAWSMAAFIFPFAFFVGGLVHHVGSWLNI
jgi:ferrous iron transport protein B